MENTRTKSNTTEYVSKDIMDEDFLKVFTQFRHLQMLLGSCRVEARHRFVTAPTVLQKIYTVVTVLLVFAVYIELAGRLNTIFINYQYLQILCMIIVFGHLLFFILNIIHVRFCCNSENVDFYLHMQQSHRVLKKGHNKTLNRLIYNLNSWTLTVILIVLCSLIAFACTTKRLSLITAVTVVVLSQSPLLIDIYHCANLMGYFTARIFLIRVIVSNYLEKLQNVYIRDTLPVLERRFIDILGPNESELTECPVELYLRDTFNAFLQFQELYKFQIFLFSSKLVLYLVLTFEFTLQILQNNIADRIIVTILVTLNVLDLIGMLFLSLRCEVLRLNIKKIKILAISVMSLNQNGPLRDRAKKIYNMIEDVPPTFSVYGMWVMEARVFIKICNVVTGLFVTLLQFAVL